MEMWSSAASDTPTLVPLRSGRRFRVDSPPGNGLMTPALAAELSRVLEHFAAEAGFDERAPVGVYLRPGTLGHHRQGRAADIYAVGGVGLDAWKERWDRAGGDGAEPARNLGWRLYRTLQRHGRWAQPPGYPVQLFGPFTREAGPWFAISDGLLRAHRDHIHVAK